MDTFSVWSSTDWKVDKGGYLVCVNKTGGFLFTINHCSSCLCFQGVEVNIICFEALKSTKEMAVMDRRIAECHCSVTLFSLGISEFHQFCHFTTSNSTGPTNAVRYNFLSITDSRIPHFQSRLPNTGLTHLPNDFTVSPIEPPNYSFSLDASSTSTPNNSDLWSPCDDLVYNAHQKGKIGGGCEVTACAHCCPLIGVLEKNKLRLVSKHWRCPWPPVSKVSWMTMLLGNWTCGEI